MNHLLAKHVTTLLKLELPNIKIRTTDDISTLKFVYYYKKKYANDKYPLLFSTLSDELNIVIEGEINLKDYPAQSPQTILYGDIGHCHVYKLEASKFKICHSLDRSFEWYFKGSQTSLFNPSMNLVQYVINIYRFLAEDDRSHDINNLRCSNSYDYWKNYNIDKNNMPSITMNYIDCLGALDNILYASIKEMPNEQYNDIDKNLVYVDYVDKTYLLNNFDDAIIPIIHDYKRGKHKMEIKIANFMKYNYFCAGVRKTSYGYIFTNCIPCVIDSKMWNINNIYNILNDQIEIMFKDINSNPIYADDNNSKEDYYLYVIFELIVELANNIFDNKKITPCDRRILVQIYHLSLTIINKINTRIEYYINLFDNDMNTKSIDEQHFPNLMIICAIYLYKNKNIPPKIISELITRIIYRALFKVADAKKCVALTEKFNIIDSKLFIEYIWSCSKKYIIALGLIKNMLNSLRTINLDMMDDMLGLIDIYVDNTPLMWDTLNGYDGFALFADHFNLNEIINNIMMSFNKYIESDMINKIILRWNYYNSTYGPSYGTSGMQYPSDII